MARSRRHAPIAGITTADSEKQDKQRANRIHRSTTRRVLKRDADPDASVLPTLRDVSDEWAMAKDGRAWFGNLASKMMRK